jgi:protease-4
LLLRVNSPGGTVSASETLHHEVSMWKAKTGRPVVAYFDGIAASGGYYVAMASDEVIAHPTAITGSIGVIMSGINLSGLMERFGIEDQSFTSGRFKDSGSPLREMRPDERAHFEGIVDDLHARFREVVAQGRPGLDSARVDELADGRVFTARQAAELGLVDRIGHLDQAVEALEQRLGVTESQLIVYQRPGEYRDNVYTKSGGGTVQLVDIDLFPFEPIQLEPGFYYLWPPAGFR